MKKRTKRWIFEAELYLTDKMKDESGLPFLWVLIWAAFYEPIGELVGF
jgi:hypothetical protein